MAAHNLYKLLCTELERVQVQQVKVFNLYLNLPFHKYTCRDVHRGDNQKKTPRRYRDVMGFKKTLPRCIVKETFRCHYSIQKKYVDFQGCGWFETELLLRIAQIYQVLQYNIYKHRYSEQIHEFFYTTS